MPDKLCILVCENFEKELTAAVELEKFDDVITAEYPAKCGFLLSKWADLGNIESSCPDCVRTEILGCGCVRGLGEPPGEVQDYRLRKMEQCFYMFANKNVVDSYLKEGIYLITPGWLTDWRQRIDEWGFDKNMAREFFAESTRQLLLLDTGVDEKSPEYLREFAAFINRPFETVPVGLDYFRLFITKIVMAWRLEKELSEFTTITDHTRKQMSDYAMAMDLLGKLTQTTTEIQAVDTILELFTSLFAPEEIIYIPVKDGKPGKVRTPSSGIKKALTDSFEMMDEDYAWTASGLGFRLRISRRDELLGILEIDKIAFPEYKEHYLNLALTIVALCGMAIDNARTFRKLVDTAHIAGKAELATNILHNVGNVLNSINISSEYIKEQIQKSSVRSLTGIVDLMNEHRDDLGAFITNDPRGRKLPVYFDNLAVQTEKERQLLDQEISSLAGNIEHVKNIINMQQAYSDETAYTEPVYLEELIENAISINETDITANDIEITRDYEDIGPVLTHKHKILQILVNLIRNAIDAIVESGGRNKQIKFSLSKIDVHARIEVVDSGAGIKKEDLTHIFAHGFTTKKSLHGFGLHSAANLATETGGALTAHSSGAGKGATFRLEVPLKEPGTKESGD